MVDVGGIIVGYAVVEFDFHPPNERKGRKYP